MDEEQKAYNEWLANMDELRHITNIGERLEQAERELARLRAENAGLLRENMDLRARLYDQGQHPGFPQPDPDEPVAGTA